MKKISNLSLESITIIQLTIAAIISLLFQFVFPLSWQPLDAYRYGPNIQHGDPGTNLVIFTITIWWFSLSLAWFFYQDNPYINNFLIYSIIPLSMIVIYEVFFVGLYYDYIHILPIIVDIFILWKKRDMMTQKYIPHILIILTIWFFAVYFLKLAYYQAPLPEFIINYLFNVFVTIIFSFIICKGNKIKD
ncbi:MAG: hypothetical protein ACTSQJ_05480 [Promethearchaeota archaeon]